MDESSLEQDAELVRQTLAGDDGAFKKLMEKYVRIAGSIAYSVVGDFHIAADMVQEAFVKVYRLLSTLENPKTFRSYLANAVRSSALDWVRRQKSLSRGSPIAFADYAEEEPELEDEGPRGTAPLQRVENSEMYNRILDLVAELPETYREVFVLKHIEDVSYTEIADILGISVSAVEARLFRARKMLRDKLARLE